MPELKPDGCRPVLVLTAPLLPPPEPVPAAVIVGLGLERAAAGVMLFTAFSSICFICRSACDCVPPVDPMLFFRYWDWPVPSGSDTVVAPVAETGGLSLPPAPALETVVDTDFMEPTALPRDKCL